MKRKQCACAPQCTKTPPGEGRRYCRDCWEMLRRIVRECRLDDTEAHDRLMLFHAVWAVVGAGDMNYEIGRLIHLFNQHGVDVATSALQRRIDGGASTKPS